MADGPIGVTDTGPDLESPAPVPEPEARPAFAHESEAELARILDFYTVRWEYEPHTFPILWNLDGDVLESFSPDFYLPDVDLYVELTTLKQRLVRKKNRKLRRLRELYPDIQIKLFYARDFRALMLKYGKLALIGELSGALGQVVPARPSGEAAEAVAESVAAPAAAELTTERRSPADVDGAAARPPALAGSGVAEAGGGVAAAADLIDGRSGTGRRRRRARRPAANRTLEVAADDRAGAIEGARTW